MQSVWKHLIGGVLAIGLCSANAHGAGSAPAAPPNLTGDIVDDTVFLQWNIPSDDDVIEGYNVYINNQYVDTVASPAYEGTVEPGVLYSFYVVAFDSPPRRFSSASEQITLPENLIPDDLTIPPTAPTALSGLIEDGSIMLSWVASTDDEAVQGYNVYRDNQYLTTVASPFYTGLNTADESHSWYVVAFDIRKNFSSRSQSIRLPDTGPVDTTIPPSVPDGLTGFVDPGSPQDTVSFSWEPATDDQAVAGYNVYKNGDYIATRFSNDYTGQVEAGSSNRFQVVSFDFDGNFSSSSERLTLPQGSAPQNPGIAPTVPTGLAVENNNANGDTQVLLTWEPSTSSVAVSGYNVYRNNDYLTTVRNNSFTDSVPSGEGFSYSVVAFDDFENYSARSEQISLTSSINQPPFFSDLQDQVLVAGQPWELLLKPVDIEGDLAGILIGSLPQGAQFVDNLDGTRSLTWIPTLDDIGDYPITITAFDLEDIEERTVQTIMLRVVDTTKTDEPQFAISVAQNAYNLIEGSDTGVVIPITLIRMDGAQPITLSVETDTPADSENLTIMLSDDQLSGAESESALTVKLDLDVLPILAHQRRLNIQANDGLTMQQVSVTVAVTPTAADDIYLLIGQSNMVGNSEDGAKLAGAGEPDAPHPRIRQANVSENSNVRFSLAEDFTNVDNDFRSPQFVVAEDPLHRPQSGNGSKSGSRIGMGLSFAKAALQQTSRGIVLVPAAWSSSAFCDTDIPSAQWNALPSDNPALGNTWLFDRALARLNETLFQTGGVLRGILWHQGESDSKEQCVDSYAENLQLMVSEFRKRASIDGRGSQARGQDSNIPFVVGTMSRGRSADSDFSIFDNSKTLVDNVHKTIDTLIPFSAVTNNDDLVPDNGYPCASSCVHFGSAALREMGVRTYESLLRAAGS